MIGRFFDTIIVASTVKKTDVLEGTGATYVEMFAIHVRTNNMGFIV